MKELYKHIIPFLKINCSAFDDEWVTFWHERNMEHSNEIMFFELNTSVPNTDFPLSFRLKKAWNYLINPNSYYNGENQTANAILVGNDLVEEIYAELLYVAISYKLIESDEELPEYTWNDFTEKYIYSWGKKGPDPNTYTLILWKNDEGVLSADIFEKDGEILLEELLISTRHKSDFKARLRFIKRYLFSKGPGYPFDVDSAFLTREDFLHFTGVFKFIVDNFKMSQKTGVRILNDRKD